MFRFFTRFAAPALVSAAQLVFSPHVFAADCGTPVDSSAEGAVICDLGVLEGGDSSFSKDVSDDGLAVAGVSTSAAGERAFLWTAEEGMISLGVLPGGSESRATGISADGSTVVGKSDSADGWRAFRWTRETGMVSLGVIGGATQSGANAVSADGTVIAGSLGGIGGRSAFRWTAEDGMTDLGTVQFDRDSAALGISGDGEVVVGRLGFQAFRWSADEGIVPLEAAEGKKLRSAHDASRDGVVIVGEAGSFSKGQAFHWSSGGRSQLLPPMAETRKSGALGVNSAGSTVVGYIKGTGAQIAFSKTQDGPLVLLGRLKDSGSYRSSKASGVSADGQVVVGSSSGPDGNRAVLWRLGPPD